MPDRKLDDRVPHYNCASCFDRGYYRVRKLNDRGWGEGPWLHIDCEKCGGTGGRVQKERQLTPEEVAAIEWFKTAKPPEKEFALRPGRMVRNPSQWWKIIVLDLEDIGTPYREKAISVVVRLYELFGERELEVEEELSLEPEEKELEL